MEAVNDYEAGTFESWQSHSTVNVMTKDSLKKQYLTTEETGEDWRDIGC